MSEQEIKKMSKRKQSIIAGGLITSAGLFFSKFIGLFYVVPFNTILGGGGSDNLAYYGVAFSIYTYVLNIATAGFPFAIATMVAKYTTKGDYQTALLIKKLSSGLMIALGFVMMSIMILISTPLGKLVLPVDDGDPYAMRNVLILISFALFFVPFLSSIRGFYQGLKEMEVYAMSQVLEQIVRVAFLLICSAVAVYVLDMDRIWAVYLGVLAASVAAICAYLQMKLYDRKQLPELQKFAKKQEICANTDKKEILKELVFIAIPFLLVSVLGYSDMLVNTIFLNKGLEAYGNTNEEIKTISGIINTYVQKLIAIPMILAPGFSGAIIPHITAALIQKNFRLIRKNIRDCIDIVLYIAIPICFCLFVYARPINDILFTMPADVLDMSAEITSWFAIEAFLSTLAPVFTSLMMAARLQRVAIRNLFFMAIIKVGSSYFFLAWLGYPGLIASTFIAYVPYIAMNAYTLSKIYHVQWKYTLHKICIILMGLAGIYLTWFILDFIGLKGYGAGRMMSLLQVAVNGTLALCVYFAITYIFQIPQTILKFDLKKLMRRKKRG